MTSRASADQQDVALPAVRGAATTEPDDTIPTLERQTELRSAYDANIAAGKPPYANVRLRSRGEVRWILQERGWSGEYDAYTVKYVLAPKGEEARAADLRGVNLSHVPLRDVYLRRADLSGANLVFADLTGAHLADVTLNDADMGRVILHRGELNYATLTGAHLRQADLSSANLQYTNIARGALPQRGPAWNRLARRTIWTRARSSATPDWTSIPGWATLAGMARRSRALTGTARRVSATKASRSPEPAAPFPAE